MIATLTALLAIAALLAGLAMGRVVRRSARRERLPRDFDFGLYKRTEPK
ncbi:hypothetical protein NNJEOMEG_02095 [Fundidesulfovibrio magnetotacticus]|uniref:Uncharacterized protein n=1 Tax=Fundidesulfovibrio magnetotacticus TaxID=2730080 RepID=A0A6V8LNS0_9BACT|nr:hypothetical protein [Fundidesulfovibrio magnetotacticus]GFK94253.1 hypothetical protein NNJEOMEG_02095 [Fundidesulfovibrio magnetotacticus]